LKRLRQQEELKAQAMWEAWDAFEVYVKKAVKALKLIDLELSKSLKKSYNAYNLMVAPPLPTKPSRIQEPTAQQRRAAEQLSETLESWATQLEACRKVTFEKTFDQLNPFGTETEQ
jgi:FtsZ-binding cell division protein ZapB